MLGGPHWKQNNEVTYLLLCATYVNILGVDSTTIYTGILDDSAGVFPF